MSRADVTRPSDAQQGAGGVDVLAVLDRQIGKTARAMRRNFDNLTADDFESINEQRAARAAVAELIAAASADHIRQTGCSHNNCACIRSATASAVLCEKCVQWGRFRSALAACGGAK